MRAVEPVSQFMSVEAFTPAQQTLDATVAIVMRSECVNASLGYKHASKPITLQIQLL